MQGLKGLRPRIFQRRVDFVMVTDLPAPVPPGMTDRLLVLPITREHREGIEAHIRRYHGETAQSLAMIDENFRRGFGGFAGLLDGEIIGYRWWAGHDHDHPHFGFYGFRPAADEVYAFGLYIARPFRKHGHAVELVAKTLDQLLALGYRRIYSLVQQDNLPSLKVQSQLGARQVARRPVVRFFDRIVWCGGRLHRHDPLWM